MPVSELEGVCVRLPESGTPREALPLAVAVVVLVADDV